MDWSVGGDGDGYVTPVSECVKCREVAWEEGANTVVEGPVLKILAYTCTLPRFIYWFLYRPIYQFIYRFIYQFYDIRIISKNICCSAAIGVELRFVHKVGIT